MLTSALLLATLTSTVLALPSPTTLPSPPILPSLLPSSTTLPSPPILPSLLPTPTATSYPPLKTARAFRLVFNVTDPSKDFPAPHSLHGSELWPRDFFGPESTRGTVFPPKSGGLFFQTPRFNRTGQPPTFEDRYRSSVQAQYGDFFIGLFAPYVDKEVRPVRFYKDSLGTAGMQLGLGGKVAYVNPFEREGGGVKFVVCNETIEFPTGPSKWLTLGTVAEEAAVVEDECVEVRLVPECNRLGLLSENISPERKAVFKAASEVRCYEDVQGIEWGKYSYSG